MNWISIDPGSPTGITIWNENGKHVITLTLKYVDAVDYTLKFRKLRDNYNIQFALIENFVQFRSGRKAAYMTFNASKVQTQLQICKEVFLNHILVNTKQWNSGNMNDKTKRLLVSSQFGIKLKNSHETDSFLIGVNIWNKVDLVTAGKAFLGLFLLATIGKKKYPTQKEKAPWDDLFAQHEIKT